MGTCEEVGRKPFARRKFWKRNSFVPRGNLPRHCCVPLCTLNSALAKKSGKETVFQEELAVKNASLEEKTTSGESGLLAKEAENGRNQVFNIRGIKTADVPIAFYNLH